MLDLYCVRNNLQKAQCYSNVYCVYIRKKIYIMTFEIYVMLITFY